MNVALLVMQTGIAKNKFIYVSSFVRLNKWHLNMHLIYFEQVCIFLHIAVFFPQTSFNRATPIPSPDAHASEWGMIWLLTSRFHRNLDHAIVE